MATGRCRTLLAEPLPMHCGKRIAAMAVGLLLSAPLLSADLARIEIIPAFVTLGSGETQRFEAIGYDAAGGRVEVTPSWVVSAGEIDALGSYTAPAARGLHRIEARVGSVLALAAARSTGARSVWPSSGWTTATPADADLDVAALDRARNHALSGGGSGFVVREGRLVYSWGSRTALYDLKSATKSIGGTVLGLAIGAGRVQLDDTAQSHLPAFGLPPDANAAKPWLGAITVWQLATHTAAFDKPGGYTELQLAPGTRWWYSDGGANWLADVLTQAYGQDLQSVLFSGALSRMQVTAADLAWRANAFREDTLNGVKRRELASGISADIEAMARIGLLYLRRGLWNGERLLPETFIRVVQRPRVEVQGLPVNEPADFPGASNHYGVLWWTNAAGALARAPRDAYWAWGLGDSLLIVIPSLDLVVARAGEGWRADWNADYAALAPFLMPIVEAVRDDPPPLVSAGADQELDASARQATVSGAVLRVGRPRDRALETTWSVVSGAGVTLASPENLTTAVTFPAPGEYVLRLTATDGAGTAEDDVRIHVAALAPIVQLAASAARVVAGNTVTLTWSSTHATGCSASGGWSGPRPPTGTEGITIQTDTSFALSCSGSGGSTSASVSVTADASGGGGGGGGMLGWLFSFFLTLLLWRRRRHLPPSFRPRADG